MGACHGYGNGVLLLYLLKTGGCKGEGILKVGLILGYGVDMFLFSSSSTLSYS